MAGEKNDPFEPRCFLESKAHPYWNREETYYVMTHLFSPSNVDKWRRTGGAILHESTLAEQKEGVANTYYEEIRQGWEGTRNKKGEYVIAAVQLLGIDALRLPPLEEKIVRDRVEQDNRYPLFEALSRLGSEVCRAMRSWRNQIETGIPKERREPREWLHKVHKALIPKTKGKRTKILNASHKNVVACYYRELFRLYHIQDSLRSEQGTKSEKVASASQKFGMQLGDIRSFWGLDEEDNPDKQPLGLREMARILTCRQFKITQPRLSNILSRWF